jgi:hypothetical protein
MAESLLCVLGLKKSVLPISIIISSLSRRSSPLSFAVHAEGNYKCPSRPHIYYVLNRVKYWYPNWDIFTSYGPADVQTVDCITLTNLETGANMPDAGVAQGTYTLVFLGHIQLDEYIHIVAAVLLSNKYYVGWQVEVLVCRLTMNCLHSFTSYYICCCYPVPHIEPHTMHGTKLSGWG